MNKTAAVTIFTTTLPLLLMKVSYPKSIRFFNSLPKIRGKEHSKSLQKIQTLKMSMSQLCSSGSNVYSFLFLIFSRRILTKCEHGYFSGKFFSFFFVRQQNVCVVDTFSRTTKLLDRQAETHLS